MILIFLVLVLILAANIVSLIHLADLSHRVKEVTRVKYKGDGYERDGAHIMVGTKRPLSDDWNP
jgi:hypothetical protein